MAEKPKKRITVFHCINSFSEKNGSAIAGFRNCEIKTVKMACSSMVKDIFLLRAFEAGADAVIVIVCPENMCRHAEGSIRAKKRVEKVQTILNEIGIGGNRLTLHHASAGNHKAFNEIIQKTLAELDDRNLKYAA